MSNPYFASGYIRVLYRFLCSEGVSGASLLRAIGIDEADLMRTDFAMPFAAQMRFCEDALARAKPGLGLRSGQQLQLAAHGALGTAMQSSENLGIALDTFIRCLGARASFFNIALTQGKAETVFRISIDDISEQTDERLKAFFTETLLLSVVHVVEFFTGRSESLDSLHLSYAAPEYGADYSAVFAVPVAFSQPYTQLMFAAELLALPSPAADPVLHADSLQRCLDEMRSRDAEVDLRYQIEAFLLENPGRLWSAKEVAHQFSVSPRTLMRRLNALQMSFQEVRDGVLKQQAVTCLNTMSVEGNGVGPWIRGHGQLSAYIQTLVWPYAEIQICPINSSEDTIGRAGSGAGKNLIWRSL